MPMTITVPDELAARLIEKHIDMSHVALAALAKAVEEETQIDDWQPGEEDLAAIGRGIADSDAGRISDFHVSMARIRERAGL